MKISLKWVQEYIDVEEFFVKPEKLAHLLTRVGLEIEGIEDKSKLFERVQVGCVRKLEKHPQADRLTLCGVDVGQGSLSQIVCGAQNHKVGDKVVVALPGAKIQGTTIKKSKIRGVESQGMMCSDFELGLSEESAGIKILPKKASVGTPYAVYAGLDDVVFELNVTPNRADCLSHVGLARELGCVLDRPVRLPSTDFAPHLIGESIKVELKDSDRCPRYSGRQVKGVKVKESPHWMRSRLEAVGMHSVNNIVDVTNYVMLELGQPLHAFDTNLIEPKIVIDQGVKGEKFQPLSGKEVELSGGELTIRDSQKVLALAGVIGGADSGVVEKTTNIFIESAHFIPKTIRQTSRHFGIHTDSSYRFCRGTDPQGVVYALQRACHLMEKVAGGKVCGDLYDEYPQEIESSCILVRHSCLEERLGYKVVKKEFHSWMKRLGCEVMETTDLHTSLLKPPTYRWDLNMEIDFVEEFARLHGYDKIPEELPALVRPPTDHVHSYKAQRILVDWMCGHYLQAVNYHFIGEKFLKSFMGDVSKLVPCGFSVDPHPILITNPLSEDNNAMRTSLIPGLIKNMLSNYRHGVKYGRLFEVGCTFGHVKGEFTETRHLSLIAWGQKDTLWNRSSQRPVIYDLKSSMESLFLHMKVSSFQWRDLKQTPDFLHPGQWAGLFFEGKMLGYIGSLHPALKQEYKIRQDVAVGEFLLEPLMKNQPKKSRLKEISKYPPVERDFAFILPNNLRVGEIIDHIKKSAGNELQSIEVFDDYRGEGVQEDHHSVAFKLLYQDKEGTLSENRLSKLHESVILAVTQKFPARVR